MIAPAKDQKAPRKNRYARGDASIRSINGLQKEGQTPSMVVFMLTKEFQDIQI
jgi:hypothetical protein